MALGVISQDWHGHPDRRIKKKRRAREINKCDPVARELVQCHNCRLLNLCSGSIRMIDQAQLPVRPSRPNKPLTLGAVVAILLGIMAGGVGAKLALGFDRQHSTNHSNSRDA